MQAQYETQPILHSHSPNNTIKQPSFEQQNNNNNNNTTHSYHRIKTSEQTSKNTNNKTKMAATTNTMAITPNSGNGHHLQNGHKSNQTVSQSSRHGKPATPRTDQSEKANIRILQEVLTKGCENGTVEKKQLPPAICRVEGMKLWREVLNTNVYNGIQFSIVSLYFIAIFSFFNQCAKSRVANIFCRKTFL